MSYKSIVVHLDASERAAYRLDVALLLATHFKAHLVAVYATFAPEPRAFGIMAASAGWYEQVQAACQERCELLGGLFHAGMARTGASGDWIEARIDARKALARHGRCADLIIAGQSDPNDPQTYVADHVAETLVMTAGRPLLLIPYLGAFPEGGANILVGWDGSREATRAVHDALPFLKDAGQVTLLTIGAGKGELPGSRIPCADIATTLARHDVRVSVRETVDAADARVGDALLSEGRSIGADLIVMGGYGHSRWQEMVLGKCTWTVLRAITIPVLMSH
ncbi:universal stress protein (plasmid) [Caballeronia sp. NK8]|uniref:universal stress protein n=1 Tax=Caballeronia sp. NK8 TaxID=140098 RepID=UPI001BB6F639|nr:universal stress protein [Caballeronia sp. NK8]BCQ28982.1 universal stress protein [Caballeronia sp. NK8]